MEYKGIIITGAANSGGAQVCESLCNSCSKFQTVPILTTRSKSPNGMKGQYKYLTREEFEKQDKNGHLIIKVEHKGYWYGISASKSFRSARNKGKIPIVALSANALSMDLIKPANIFSIFLDRPDSNLDANLVTGGVDAKIGRGVLKQRNQDREIARLSTYSIDNLDTSRTVEFILMLWEYRNRGGMIPTRFMDLAIDCGVLLKEVDDKRKIQGASYDLSLGDEYYYGGQIKMLTDKDPFICIEPYDYAIVTSKENANLPRDIAARFDLTVSLFCQGVILSNGPQIDPGFKGKLFCLLFNTSNAPVFLKRGQHYTTLEFHKLIEPTDPYKGRYQDKVGIVDYLPSNTMKGAVNELKKELEQVKAQGQGLQTTILGMLSILLAIIALLLALNN